MKKTLLATIVASLVLVGCGSDNKNSVTTVEKTSTLTVFDGAINGMDASFTCDDNGKKIHGSSEKSSDGYGNVNIKNTFFAEHPEKCTVTFKASPQGAIDMSNGKKMNNVVYSIPQGMMEMGKPATATPFSTLIAKEMASTQGNGDIDYATAKNTVFESIKSGLGNDASELTSDTFEAFLSTPAQTLKTLGTDAPKASQLIIAQTAVISDLLVATKGKSDTTLSVTNITKASAALAVNIVKENIFFPYSSADKTEIKQVIIPAKAITVAKIESIAKAPQTAAETIKVELKPVVTAKLPEATNPPIKPQPVKPTATGAAGDDNANI